MLRLTITAYHDASVGHFFAVRIHIPKIRTGTLKTTSGTATAFAAAQARSFGTLKTSLAEAPFLPMNSCAMYL